MFDQFNLFDSAEFIVESKSTGTSIVPEVNEEGFIPADQLVPIKYEAWKYENKSWTLNNGPYVIDAYVAMLPGNRLLVKEWMLYAFMHTYKTEKQCEEAYLNLRKEIKKKSLKNNDTQRTWSVPDLPPLHDMWLYEPGEFSEKEYAQKRLYGYQLQRKEGASA